MTNAEREETIERYLKTATELDQHRMPLMAHWFRARARELEIQRDGISSHHDIQRHPNDGL